MLRIKLVKSPIGNNKRNRSIVTALGLRKMHHFVDHRDTPQIRGMVHRVKHLLEVTEISESDAKPRTTGTPNRAKTTAPVPGMPRRKKVKAKKVRPMPAPKAPKPKAERVKPESKPAAEKKTAAKAKTAAPKAEAKPAKAKAEPKAKADAKPKAAKPKAEKKEDKKK